MKKDIIITLRGIHQYEDEPIEMVTEGKYYKKDNKHYITYKETELTGMEGTTTTLKVEPNKVTLIRLGSRNTQMIFEPGQRHVCFYETPFGDFSVGVSSNRLDVEIGEKSGKISADYQIEFNNANKGDNQFYMEFSEVANDKSL